MSSVAELAEKPLYRVTCGDIGTNPEDVERVSANHLTPSNKNTYILQYLESILYIGKTWGCGTSKSKIHR